MPITISIHFTRGRYHATPYGHHVNEALVEWPPSPWRILRALLAVAFEKKQCNTLNDLSEDNRNTLESLASVNPSYKLPPGGLAHTRHYMPIIKENKNSWTKVFDAFIRFDNHTPLLISYPLDFNETQTAFLKDLIHGLSYLGRSESACEAQLLENPIEPDETWSSSIDILQPHESNNKELVSLLAPLSSEEYKDFQSKQQIKQAAKSKNTIPSTLLEAICLTTDDWKKQKWNRPLGSKILYYHRPELQIATLKPAFYKQPWDKCQCALLSLSSDTVAGTLRPLMTRVLPQMEILHDSLISLAVKICGNAPQSLTGQNDNRSPLREKHIHASYYPLDLDEDNRIDHVLIYAPMTFDESAQRALASISKTWAKGISDIFVTFAGQGNLDLMIKQIRDRRNRLPQILGKSNTWESITPFIVPRFLHKSGKHSLEDQIHRECKSRNLPSPSRIEILSNAHFLKFVRKRRDNHPQPPLTYPFCLRLHFEEEIQGPISLGYASHYGLGVFKAKTIS